MKRKLTFILLALLMLGAILFAYAHTILLPTKVKEFIEVNAQDYLQRRITIGEIDYKAFKGFRISQIRIYKENGSDLLFFADEAKFNILFAALFKQKALIIPSLFIKDPSFHLIRHANGTLNALNILHETSAQNKKSRTNFLIGKIVIENGTLDYTDQTGESEFFDSYQNIDAKAAISLDRSVNFSLRADSEIRENRIEAAGKYDLGPKSFFVQSRLNNFPLSDYLSLYWNLPGLSVNGLRLTTESLTVEKKGASFNVAGSLAASESTIHYEDLEFHGPFNLEGLNFQFRDGTIKFSGLVQTDAKLSSSDGSVRHAANMKLDIRSFGYADKRYRSLLNAELNELSLSSADGSFQCDRARIEDVDISKFDALTMAIKGARCDNSSVRLPDATTLNSSISLANLRFSHSLGKSHINSTLALDRLRLKTHDGISLDANLASPSVSIEMLDGRIKAQGELNLTNTFLALDHARSFSGHPKLIMQLDYQAGAQAPLKFKGDLELTDGQLNGFAAFDPIENIRGKLSINDDMISSPSISFRAMNTDFQASGRIDSVRQRTGAVTISSRHFNLDLLTVFFPNIMKRFSVAADGPTSIDLNYEGPLEAIVKDNISLNVRLNKATVGLKESKARLENLSGLINLQSNTLSWKELELGYKGENIILTGFLKLSGTPWLSTNVRNAHLDADARLTFDGEMIFVDEIKGRFAQSTFNASGRIHHHDQSDLSLKGSLHLGDAKLLPKPIFDRIAPINPLGKLEYRASFVGDLNEWRTASIAFNAHADAIRLINYPLQQFELSYRQANGKINLFNLRSFVYEGQFNIDAEGDLTPQQISFTSHTKLDQANLIEYRKDKKTANRLLSGTLDCAFAIRGLLLEPGSYIGLGKLQIRDAYLGQLIPQMSAAVFTGTVADFRISGGKVQTDNARIISETLDLQAKGWANFKRQIDFELVPALKANRLTKAGKSRIDASTLLSKAVSIRMTGTLDNPVKQVNTSTAGVIKNTTGVIAEGIGNILGELF